MTDAEWIDGLCAMVKEQVGAHLRGKPLAELASLDLIEALVRKLVVALVTAFFEVWAETVEELAVAVALTCPGCGSRRKCRRRRGAPMCLRVLGLKVKLPKPYLACERCDVLGVSIVALLTGLQSGEASSEMKLRTGYLGSQYSYGKARREMEIHYSSKVDRTAVRRVSLEVEEHAKRFAEHQRLEALAPLEQERTMEGVSVLMLQGDGGSVRTGKLVSTEPGDVGHGELTPKRRVPKRKRLTQNREVITLDVREPGEVEPSALDLVVPIHAQEGERSRRMLALAARKGLGESTEVIGLGDMGSSLPQSFDEAFVGHPKSHYYCDWQHVRKYVQNAGEMLGSGINVESWKQKTRDAIWNRDEKEVERLLRRADKHRMPKTEHMEKCPVDALRTYLRNNWDHIDPASLKARGLDHVSGRAEAQVRDRTKYRFCVAGAWLSENIEGKAILRALIDEGSWKAFRADYLHHNADRFQRELRERLDAAVKERRIDAEQRRIILETGSSLDHSTQHAIAA